jgi:hypothetical protein
MQLLLDQAILVESYMQDSLECYVTQLGSGSAGQDVVDNTRLP